MDKAGKLRGATLRPLPVCLLRTSRLVWAKMKTSFPFAMSISRIRSEINSVAGALSEASL